MFVIECDQVQKTLYTCSQQAECVGLGNEETNHHVALRP